MPQSLVSGRGLVVLTGAGVSTDSGIPDYRGPNGVWTRDPTARRLSTRADYLADPEVRRVAWRNRLAHPVWRAEPNVAHRELAALERRPALAALEQRAALAALERRPALAAPERRPALAALLTQNIDGLHQLAGSRAVVELHGTIRQAICLTCQVRRAMAEVLDRVAAGEPDPPCPLCGGVLTSATVAFGQPLDPQVFAAALAAVRRCAVFLVVGSSLSVQPVAGLCGVAVEAGAELVIVNAEPTPYDPLADRVVRGRIAEVLPGVLRGLTAESVRSTG